MADDAGPLLVRAGMIADDQLHAARRAQAADGGTLGEQLVRLGFIDDDALTHFYRTRLLVPRVDPTRLQDIPRHVLGKLSADVAGEFRVVPVQLDQTGNLVIAMSDPSNTHAVDEISFFTDSYVVRAVASQREIAGALARYYGIETPLHAAAPPAAAAATPSPSERRRVRPPMTSPPDENARPRRVSDLVPALKQKPSDHAAGSTASKPAAHQRPTIREMAEVEPEAEPDTRPIMRADELQQVMRRSDEPPIAVSGEVEISNEDRDLSSKLPAVVVDDEALTPPPAAGPEEQPVLLDRPKRPSAEIAEQGQRPARRTRLGVGTASSAQDAAPATDADKYRYSSLIPTVSVDEGWEDDGFGPPGTTIPPFYLGAVPGALDDGSPIGVPVTDATEESGQKAMADSREAFDASAARLEQALFYISVADSRDGIINGLVETLGSWCERAAFFAVSHGELRRWKAQGRGVIADPPSDTALSLERPSTFQDIVATRLPVRGPLHDPASRDFLDATLGVQPTDMLALPITVKNKVVGILYGDKRRVVVYDEHLNALIRAGGEALERIIRERRTR